MHFQGLLQGNHWQGSVYNRLEMRRFIASNYRVGLSLKIDFIIQLYIHDGFNGSVYTVYISLILDTGFVQLEISIFMTRFIQMPYELLLLA